MYNTILYSVENGIATITLNRPDTFNAFNEEMSREFIDSIKQASKDATVRTVVVTGAGEKAFCSGQYLKDVNGKQRSLSESVLRRYNPMILGLREMPKPVIGKVNGVAAGAGASLAFACDYVVAATHVNFVEAFVNIGLVPDSGSSWFLVQTLGYNKAFELCALGSKFSATEAQSWNLINRVVTKEELDKTVSEVAVHFAQAPTKSIGMIKKMLNKALSSNLDEALLQEAYHQEMAGRSSDYKEGVQAFVEKRKAFFTGQ